MGEGESEARLSPFQSMNAVERMRRKLRDWARMRRGCVNIVSGEGCPGGLGEMGCGGVGNANAPGGCGWSSDEWGGMAGVGGGQLWSVVVMLSPVGAAVPLLCYFVGSGSLRISGLKARPGAVVSDANVGSLSCIIFQGPCNINNTHKHQPAIFGLTVCL